MLRRRRWLLGLAVAALRLVADAFWLEPRVLLGRDDAACRWTASRCASRTSPIST